jgi:histidinol-phosphate aminotransferase
MARADAPPPVVVIGGPTGSGKSALALRICHTWGGEIVSADSVQVYQRLDIGSAKPTRAEREQVRHHVVDFLPLDSDYDAGRFATDAREAIADIQSRDRLPVVVGGTGLYLRALLFGLADAPPRDDALRKQLQERAGAQGAATLHAELVQVDPAYAAKIHPNDGVRIVRGLEVFQISGRPLSAWHAEQTPGPALPATLLCLNPPRRELFARIDRRVEAMFEAGWIDEVRAILDDGFAPDLKSLGTLGYRHLIAHVRDGVDLKETARLIARDHRRFAKRQLTWFRGQPDVRWFASPEAAMAAVAGLMESPMNSLEPARLRNLKAYEPGKPIEELRRERGLTGPIHKLASNENPLGPSPKAVAAATDALRAGHLYPDGGAFELRDRLARHLGVPIGDIVVGNGSDELMDILIRAVATQAHHAVISRHGFLPFALSLTAAGVPFTRVPMREPLTHDLPAMAAAVQPNTRLVFVVNPNNPTGTHIGRDELEPFLATLAALPDPPVVVLDEAYFEFAAAADYPNSLDYRDRYPRLCSFRTFSKVYGLAAFRVGYMVTTSEIAGLMHRVRKPFNVGRVSQAAAVAALDDRDFLRRTLELNAHERERVAAAIGALGLYTYPSQTNFLLVRTARPGREIYDALLDHGIIVRPVDGYELPDCVRISIGQPAQNDALLTALAAVLEAA